MDKKFLLERLVVWQSYLEEKKEEIKKEKNKKEKEFLTSQKESAERAITKINSLLKFYK